jgi:hypothetical protein
MDSSIITAAVGLAGLAGTVFYYAVIKPLTGAIADLRDLIRDMREDLQRNEGKRQEMDLRLVAVEESAKSAHHRIDGIERG